MDNGSFDVNSMLVMLIWVGIGIACIVRGMQPPTGPWSDTEATQPERPAEPTPKAPPETAAEPAPAAEAPPAPEPAPVPKPENLFAKRPDQVDDLKQIKGVGPKMEAVLNAKGVYQFAQIAVFTEADLAWLDAATGSFPGRAERDDWVGQARDLAEG